jgi:hypothetical protein
MRGGFMKNLVSVFTILLMFLFTSCKSDSSNPTSTGIGGLGGPGGGGGNNSVAFTISQQPGNTGVVFFAAPSVAVVITSVAVSLPAQSFTDTVPGDGTTVFAANVAVSIREYTGVASGQKWTFVFIGKLTSSTGTAFTATANYTVP